MRIFEKTKWSVFSIIIGITILFGTISVTADAGDTTVSLSPSSQTVSSEDIFNVNVSCVPGQPIKAFEFRLSFNPSLLQANSVTKGDIFDGYSTFFNPGTIDNNAGTIVDVYGLIIGSGNVSENGTFVMISFTAKDPSGTSSLDINDVGVTDEVGYLAINVSDGSVTVQGSGGGSPPGGGGYIPPAGGGNNAPETPMTPSGPMFVELGVEYQYTSSAIDPDGDDIRYRFDWGDGNMSNWTAFVPSNTSVLSFHSWASISTFAVHVLAQDENGLNSSWSLPLNVTVSAIDFEGEPPVADFSVPSNASTNQTIVFDASGSFDEDGVIISYLWDFGDGKTGTGSSPSHIYETPGEYHVILTVTDNKGNTCNKTMLVNVASDVEGAASEDKQILPTYFGFIFIGASGVILVCLLVFFRNNIKVLLASHNIRSVSHQATTGSSKKIKKIDYKIEKLRRKMGQY